MTRIIAGVAGGRRLGAPPGDGTRPTSDRVREALFSMLDARDAVRGARVLDLYAGSGALGLEAASRGAVDVVLVDHSRPAVAVARRNVSDLRLAGVRVVGASVRRHLSTPCEHPADLVLLDPPYALSDADLAGDLEALNVGGWLRPGGVVVVERSSRSPEPAWPAAWSAERPRRYGETTLWTATLPADDRSEGSAVSADPPVTG
jgi:16S rRNA (guanine966-N2)-methyltransferase